MLLIRFIILFLVVLSPTGPAYAQAQAPIIIRDAEIENMLQEWMEPIFEAADMEPNQVKIILVQDDSINAFVAGGPNIFMFTGLLESTKDPGEVIGVMAHELGHITSSHLVGKRDALERASYESILGSILGIGAAIATGDSRAAMAISSGSSNIAARRFLAFSRVNESSADQAAMNYLEGAEINPTGLVSFFNTLQSQELLPVSQQIEYVRTHPLTSNRIEFLEKRLAESPYVNKGLPTKWFDQHTRMKAKIIGYTKPGRVPWVYHQRDDSIPALYARAFAAYRQDDIDTALPLIDKLLKREPDNAYFLELKGQILVNFSRIDEALPYYRRAVELNESALLKLALGHALLETNRDEDAQEAISLLERALEDEPRSTQAHRLLGTAHGRLGDENRAKLHLAEEALMQKRIPYAKRLAEDALRGFEENSREWIQVKDILAYIENTEKRKN